MPHEQGDTGMNNMMTSTPVTCHLFTKAEADEMARSAATDDIVGALLAEDPASAPPDGFEQLSPKFRPIFDILGQLVTEYSAARPRRAGESVHLFLLGVAEGFGGRGIAQRLVA
jgi:hypothetical protein